MRRPAGPHGRGYRGKFVLSLFIVLNLGTAFFANTPAHMAAPVHEALSTVVPERTLAQASYRIRQYAHLVGLDNRWTMFAYFGGQIWKLEIVANYADGAAVVLPLPFQSERSFAQNALFDFREAKQCLNLYQQPLSRRGYAQWLASRFPEHAGQPIESIEYRKVGHYVVTPSEARETGSHLGAPLALEVLDTVRVKP